MAEIENTAAAEARFLGPQVPSRGDAPQWWLETRVDYGGPDVGNSRPVVFKRLGLSALAQRAKPDVIDTALHGKVAFRSPTLLKAYPSATEGTLSLLTLTDSVRVSGKVLGVASADGLPLVVSPAASRWPDQELQHALVGKINFPWMRVGEGRLVVGIPANASNPIAKYLRLKNTGDLLDGVRVALTGASPGILQVELTPEGMEFEADLPDPTSDFHPGGSPTIRAIVRLEITGSGQAALRLVGAAQRAAIDDMEGRLASALAQLQVMKTPASVRFDARPAVPSIRWLLEEKNGTLRAPGKLAQGEWSVLLDEKTVGVRIASGGLEPRAVATVGAGTVMLSRAANAITLQVNARDDLNPAVTVEFQRQGTSWTPSSTMKDVDVTVDLDVPADQLQALYTQARAISRGEQPPYIFLPVRDGWVQAPLPPQPDVEDRNAPSPVETPSPLGDLPVRPEGEPSRPRLSGQLLSQGPAFRPGRSLVVESAAHAEITITWARADNAAPMEPTHVRVRMWQPAGQLRGYLFAAETSPTAEEVVPNLIAGEAATRDLALAFGVIRTGGRWWDARFTANGGGWELRFQLPAASRQAGDWRAWMRDRRAAFVGIVPLTRSVRGSARPSPSRDLFPLVLRMPPPNGAAELLLAEDALARVPRATYAGEVAFAAAAETLFDTVMPTLPGVQFRPRIPAANTGGDLNRWTWDACWRHGLPALDEFFGSIEVPRRRPDATTVSPPAANLEPAVTALRPGALHRTWFLSADKISLSWVQDRFAFLPWLATGKAPKAVEVIGWAQPYAWKTTAAISLDLPASTTDARPVPLGSYTLNGVSYALAGALPGIGKEGIAKRFAITANKLVPHANGKVGVLGMAIGAYDDSGFVMDARGFGVTSRFSRRPGALQRQAKLVLASDKAAGEFSLLTLAKPLRIPAAAPVSNDLMFYVRDLPVTIHDGVYAFDGSANAVESAAGAGGEAFEREHFGSSLHEWRLFEWANCAPTRRYDIGYGPLSFVPLRLWKFEAKDAGDSALITSLWVLGRLELSTSAQAWVPGSGIAPFGPEEPYKAGGTFMLKFDAQSLRLDPIVVEPLDGHLSGSRLQVPAVSPLGAGLAYIRADAIQSITCGGTPDSPERMPLLLGLEPTQGGAARLHARLFGDDRLLAGTVTQFQNNLLVLEFPPPGSLTGVARASTITVSVVNKAGPSGAPAWETTIDLGIELVVKSGNSTLFKRSANGQWQWMNLPSGAHSPGNTLRISHESGAISLDIAADPRTCEPLLGFPVTDFEVRGFLAHVFPAGNEWPATKPGGPLFMEVHGRGNDGFLLRHRVEGIAQSVTMDWRTTCTSIIRWPRSVAVERYAVSSDWGYNEDSVRMVGIPPAAPADLPIHVIELSLHEQPIPLESLGDTGGGFGITAVWAFLAAAGHRLKSGGDTLSWHTLDRIEILPASKLEERDDAFEFAARFRSGTYRAKKTDESRIPHPGVAQLELAQSGFVESKMPRAFTSSRPVMRGTSATTFVDDATEIHDPQGFVTQVAWMADTAANGALHGLVLAQCHPSVRRDWRFSSVDAALAAKKLLLHRQQGELHLSVDANAAEVDLALRNALKLGAAHLASQRPVTQAWFEPFDLPNRKPLTIDGFGASEIPYFPETLLVFDKLWQSRRPTLEARTIFAKGDASGRTVHVRLRAARAELRKTGPRSTASDAIERTDLDVLAVDRERVSKSPELLTVVAAAPGNLLGPDADSGRGRARIRELVKRDMPTPRVIFVRADLGSQRSKWQVVQMPKPPDDFGARLHVDSPRPIPASAALGWPSHEATARAGQLGPVGSVDEPIVSPRAGIAGRGSSIRLPAWAPGKDGPEALYVSFATHVAFDRPHQVVYTGPAARHLSVAPARLRAPLFSATQEALRKLLGEKDAGNMSLAAICPPTIERTSIGDRPGELHAWTASVVVPAEDYGFDPDDVGYGRPAASSPVLARQHRAPRSPLLPADRDPGLRRRTYVSTYDEHGAGLAEMKLFGVPATLMRLYDADGEMRCGLAIHSDGADVFRLGEGWDGKLHVRLDTMPVQPILNGDEATQRLCKAGLLPASPSASAAQVRIGNERFPFKEWSYDLNPQGAMLTFSMDQGRALQVLASLRASNVDVPIAFALQLGQQGPGTAVPTTSVPMAAGQPAAIRTWPVRNLTIPLQRAAGPRATLPVDLHTVAFGDAAYDRQLSAPTFESPPTTLADGARLVLAVDREEYNLEDTVLLIAGIRNTSDEKPLPGPERLKRLAAGLGEDELRVFLPPPVVDGALMLQVEVQPRRKESDLRPPPLRKLRFPEGENASVRQIELQPPSGYALHPRSLVELDGSPAVFESGDRLVLTVKCMKPGDKEDDDVKSCALMVRLTDLPSISPPPSVYSLVTAPPHFTRATVAVHACSPFPDALEYPDLLVDLYRGMVQRRALFIWMWSNVEEQAALATLVKVDRSGGTQLPRGTEDFVEMPAGSVRDLDFQALMSPFTHG